MLTRLRHILEMIRFSHTLFALPFALLAAVMAWCLPAAEGGVGGPALAGVRRHRVVHGHGPQRRDGF